MDRKLDPVEARVLGVLVEKQMTTPEAYPLTLSAIVAGGNQATNRDPVMALDESDVETALVRLHDLGVATPVRRPGDRATKYRHKLGEVLEVDAAAQAVLAVLLLRGAQTVGELRARTERYASSVGDMEAVVDRLEEAGWAARLPRAPGQSQRRVVGLLAADAGATVPGGSGPTVEERLERVERRLDELLRRLGVDDI